MKKVILAVVAFVGLGFTQMSAQQVSGGIKVDANMSNFILSDDIVGSSNFGFGATLGGFGVVGISQHFALQPELLFHFKSSEMESESEYDFGKTDDYQYFGMEIPLYAVGQMRLGNGRAFVGVGPYAGFGFSAKMKDADTDFYKKEGEADEAALTRWDFGAGVMLGYEFINGFMINAGYKIGLSNNLDAGKDDAKMRSQTISLGIGYSF